MGIKYNRCDPAWPPLALRSGVYLHGQDTTERVRRNEGHKRMTHFLILLCKYNNI